VSECVSVQTAEYVAVSGVCVSYRVWAALREIEVGLCDSLTYRQVEQQFPHEFAARKAEKLRYNSSK